MPVVEPRREDERAHAALVIVVRTLQQVGGLACIHGRVIEIELGHGRRSRKVCTHATGVHHGSEPVALRPARPQDGTHPAANCAHCTETEFQTMIDVLRGLLGLAVLLLIAFALSMNRRAIQPRVVLAALATQVAIGALVLFVPWGRIALGGAATAVGPRHRLRQQGHRISVRRTGQPADVRAVRRWRLRVRLPCADCHHLRLGADRGAVSPRHHALDRARARHCCFRSCSASARSSRSPR